MALEPAVPREEESVPWEEEASLEAVVGWEEEYSAVASLLEVEESAALVATSWQGVDPPRCGDVSQPQRSNLQV